jgi:membrane protease YdiL (CAAX protease family)
LDSPAQQRHSTAWSFADLAILIGMAAPSLLLAAGAGKLVAGLVPNKGLVTMAIQLVLYGGILLSLYFLLRLRHGLDFWHSLGWRIPWRGMWESALTGPVLAVSLTFLAFALKAPKGAMAIESLISDRLSLIVIGLGAVLIGPIFEELVFRGFAQPLLIRALGVFGGLLACSLPFALLHGPQYKWSWQHLLVLTVASMIFGLVRYRTGSTAASTLAHASYNLTFFSALVLQGDKFKNL